MLALNEFDYSLPEQLIRKKGVEPRDSAKLFVYDTKTDTVTFDIFKNIANYLPEKSHIVLNNTRVVPARLWLTKETGGKIEVFVLMNELQDVTQIPVLVDRKITVGQKLFFPDRSFFEVVEQQENRFFVKLSGTEKTLSEMLEACGQTPLPHYLEGENQEEGELRKRYQTLFAQEEAGASVAAPTASLHFTERVFDSLAEKNIHKVYLTLDVGLGTFAPLKKENFTNQKLHPERVTVTEEALGALRKNVLKIAVGTTVARSLESLAQKNITKEGSFITDIFITPGYQFQNTDILITNFHLPKSSLMMLVEAFLQYKGAKKNLVSLYKEAIEKEFTFYSFGDSMLIL